ncbi:hypothetical protein V8C34DRAFT_319377 [Trichoderma compactum]
MEAIRGFSKRLDKTVFPEAAIDIVAWHNDKSRQSWHTHCQKMDDIWDDYRASLADILGDDSDFDLSTMAKPSGPLGAVLHMQWHYPVNTATRVGHQHRHVMDPNNMSFKLKFGAEKWAKIEELSVEFSYSILKSAPIVLLVGKHSLRGFEKRLRDDASIRLKKVWLRLGGMTMFKERPFFYVVYQEGEIRQLVFSPHHTSHFLFGGTARASIYSDLIWNTAASLACVEVLSLDSFSRFVQARGEAPKTQTWQKAVESNRSRNWANLGPAHAANEERGFPGLQAHTRALANREPHAMAVQARRMETRSRNQGIKRLNKLHALLNSKEVVDLLDKPATFYVGNALGELYDRIAEHHGWPQRWRDFSSNAKGGYHYSLQEWYKKLQAWKQSDTAFTALTMNKQCVYLQSLAIWYDPVKAPNGLRYVGDKGPEILEAQDAPSTLSPAITLFWHASCMYTKNLDDFRNMLHRLATSE